MGQPERLMVQQRVAERGEIIAARITAAIRREIPAYSSLDDSQRRETEAIAAWGVQRLVELWVAGDTLGEADLRRFHGIGVARGTDGRPLFAVLRAYRIAAVEASTLIQEAAAGELGVDDALTLSTTLLRSLDQLSEVLFAGYTSATERLTEDRAEVVRGLADDLVTGRQTSAAALKDRSEQLGITVPATLCLTVLCPAAGGAISMGDVAQLVAAVGGEAGPTVMLPTCRAGLGVVLHAERLDLTDAARERGWRSCVIDDVALAELPAAFRTASAAARHAPPEAGGVRRPLDEADALFVALLRGEPAVDPRRFAAVALRQALDPGREHLLEGLDAYLLAGSSSEAGRALGLHAQSMRYRLRRLREITGRDLHDPWDRLLLGAASTIRRIAPD